MKRLILALTLLAACGAPPESNPDMAEPGGPLPGPGPLRTDCYNSTVPPELAPAEIRGLPQC